MCDNERRFLRELALLVPFSDWPRWISREIQKVQCLLLLFYCSYNNYKPQLAKKKEGPPFRRSKTNKHLIGKSCRHLWTKKNQLSAMNITVCIQWWSLSCYNLCDSLTQDVMKAKSYRKPKKIFFVSTPARPSVVSVGNMETPEKPLKGTTQIHFSQKKTNPKKAIRSVNCSYQRFSCEEEICRKFKSSYISFVCIFPS